MRLVRVCKCGHEVEPHAAHYSRNTGCTVGGCTCLSWRPVSFFGWRFR